MEKDKSRTRREMQGWTDLSDLKDKHLGEKCFVVGAGPTVGFLKLNVIENDVIISVNSSIMLFDWSQGSDGYRYWTSNDVLCMRWDYFWKYVLRANCTKVVRTSWKKYDEQIANHGFRYFAPRKSQSSPISSEDGGLCSVSSVPTAIDLAILMGCKKIYLLGVDQKMIHGNSHFWQFWDRKKWPIRQDKQKNFRPEQKHQHRIFEENVDVFTSLRDHAAQCGAVIKNCSTASSLKVYDFITLTDALGE